MIYKTGTKIDADDLYKSIKKHLGESAKDDARYQGLKAELGEFLSDSEYVTMVPYHQIHQYELEKIIDNQAAHYPFLAQNRDKIISISI